MVRSLVAVAVFAALSLPLGADGSTHGWKPVGVIAFTASPEAYGSSDLYLVHADGSHLRQLTSSRISEQDAAWAPDGKSIASVRLIGQGALYRLFLNGKRPRLLYREPSDARGFLLDPEWSPDGRRIAFTSRRTGDPLIWTWGLDGTLVEVTKTFSDHPTWSPDGRSIAYSGLTGTGKSAVYIVRADGSHRRRVTPETFDASTPIWSPNGKWIAFRNVDWVSGSHVESSVWIISPAGRSSRRLLGNGAGSPVAWSPKSDAILFGRGVANRPDQSQLFILALGTGKIRPVAGTYGVVGGASWHR